MPTAESAWDAWDMVKAKGTNGHDYVCLRHKRWGTEVEFFIANRGRIVVRPCDRCAQHLMNATSLHRSRQCAELPKVLLAYGDALMET